VKVKQTLSLVSYSECDRDNIFHTLITYLIVFIGSFIHNLIDVTVTDNIKSVDSDVCLMVYNATFNNISVISWLSVLLVEGPEKTTNLSQVTD
jgi:hypothetical protein